MNIEKQYAWQSDNNSSENSPSFLEMFVDLLLERADVGRQRSSSTSGVQGVEERIRGGFEQTADFQCVR